MSKHVGITSAIGPEDMYPEYDFFVYDDSDDMIAINMNAEESYYNRKHRRKVLSPMEMDMMSDKEIEEWYERNGRYGYDG